MGAGVCEGGTIVTGGEKGVGSGFGTELFTAGREEVLNGKTSSSNRTCLDMYMHPV